MLYKVEATELWKTKDGKDCQCFPQLLIAFISCNMKTLPYHHTSDQAPSYKNQAVVLM